MKNRSIAGLDLIRFAAAAMVAWFHLAYFEWLSSGAASLPRLAPFASFGWVGVEIFFVLSGFVIAYSASGKTAMRFARSRFLRLYPGVWICATLAFAAGAGDAHAYIRSMTLWPFAPYVDGVYWTLGIEMVFYGLVFMTLLVSGHRRLSVLLTTVGMVSSLFWLVWLADRLMGGERLQWTMGNRYFELLLIHYGCFFSLGGMIWLISFGKTNCSHWATAAISSVAGLICIYNTASTNTLAGKGHGASCPLAVMIFAVAAIIASVRYADKLSFVSGRISRTMGLATYPLYLLHHAVGVPFMVGLVSWGVPALVALVVALTAITLLSVAVLVPETYLRARAAIVWDMVVEFGTRRIHSA